MTRSGVLLLVALIAIGCAERATEAPTSPPSPTWAHTLPRQSGWLYAAGSAPRGDREKAVAAARAELVAEIAVSVSAQRHQEDSTTASQATTGSRVERWQQQSASATDQHADEQELPGVQVREVSDAGDTTWALVALDRAAWERQLRLRLDEIDAGILHAAGVTEPTAHPVAAAARRFRALAPLFARRDAVIARLTLAAPESPLPPAPVDIDRERRDLARSLASQAVAIVASEPRLADQAREACAAQDIHAVPAPAELELRLTPDPAHLELIHGEWRADGHCSGDLVDTASGSTLAVMSVDARASGLDEAAARQRLSEHLASAVAQRLDQELLAYLARW